MVRITKDDKIELNAIRKCSDECYFFKNGGDGCAYYTKKRVKFGQSCLYDLNQIKEYAVAFETGDTTKIKEDAAGVTAMIMMQIRRMLEQVNVEGVTIQIPMTDAKGQPVWIPDPEWKPEMGGTRPLVVAMIIKDHPLIARCIQLTRALDINLSEFKLTPKSADEKRQVSGHILAENPLSMEEVMAARKLVEDKFVKAIEDGNKMTLKDPIYQKLTDEGEVMN